ncbi:MAG: O-succinylhomoserine sulfhydrylase [Alphaproteobacteria bacterium]|nr:O-succinylhomoserine sulfhydrylase [Alphaproteobacteria bacterium]
MSKRIPDTAAWRPATKLVRGATRRSGFGETSEAMFITSGYVYDDAETAEARFKGEAEGFVYSRFGNPTVAMFEERLALIEGAEACRGTASGMAAVTAAMLSLVKAGDHVLASRALFGSCNYVLTVLLPRFGVQSTLIDGTDLKAWERELRPNTRAVFLETPSNPTLDIIDLEAVTTLAHKVGARVVVDNVFASPLLQRPLALGADIVVYSATKHIDGQGRCLGGAILGSKKYVTEELTPLLRNTGPSMSPFNGWVLLKALETLSLRVNQMCGNARTIAARLSDRPGIGRVLYPHLESHPQYALARRQMSAGGSVITLDLSGGKPAVFRFLNRLRLFDISNNLGDAKSLATHPATTTHQRLSDAERAELGITNGMVRLSIGLEDVEDLSDDLAQALKV